MMRLAHLALLAALAVTPAWAGENVLRMAFVGDVMLAETEATGRLVGRGGDPFARVRAMLEDADFRVANFESSAGTKGMPDPLKPYSFRTSKTGLELFASLFEIAGLANNHAGDFGREDFVETLFALEHAGSKTFGGGKDLVDAHRALMLERNGVKIALLGYLDFFPRWFTAAPGLAGVAWLDEDQAEIDIARAKQDGADVVVVVPHWGTENESAANTRQRRMARKLIDAGADAIIGGHPHVVQDEEIYRGKPIVYSLGNFVFDGFEDEDNNTGWALFADFDKQGLAALTTRVVRIDDDGSPMPDDDKAGPCWQRGEMNMSRCKGPASGR